VHRARTAGAAITTALLVVRSADLKERRRLVRDRGEVRRRTHPHNLLSILTRPCCSSVSYDASSPTPHGRVGSGACAPSERVGLCGMLSGW
jgi:hypothetical protein